MAAPKIRKPFLFTLVTAVAAFAAVGACLSLFSLGNGHSPRTITAEMPES